MFESYSPAGRRIVVLSQEEAVRSGHPHVGTEHLLIGLLLDPTDHQAAGALDSLGVTIQEARAQAARTNGVGDQESIGQIAFTEEARLVLVDARREASALGSQLVEPKHVLLALASAPPNEGGRALTRLRVDLSKLREALAPQGR